MAHRTADLQRETKETQIRVTVDLDGSGKSSISTGVGFFDHMLDQLARHGLMDITVQGKGDLHIDEHHLVEDTGIVLGQAFARALGDRAGIRRFGWASVPLDEALVLVSLDLSGRGMLTADMGPMEERVGTFTSSLVTDFLRACADNAGITLHVRTLCTGNTHHVLEAAFKSLANALREAVAPDPRVAGVPSTKGTL